MAKSTNSRKGIKKVKFEVAQEIGIHEVDKKEIGKGEKSKNESNR
ncbi:MAG TPA: hypothetical protein VFC73_03055 [Syntrophomonadaceae bacterium]|nr:hypothetical protein [Syntrophomonadaceae bacterium]